MYGTQNVHNGWKLLHTRVLICNTFFLHVLYSICMQGLIPNRGEQDELITMNTPLLDSVPPGDDVFFTDGQQQLGIYILVQYVSCVYYSVGSEEWYTFVRNSCNTIFQQVCYIIRRAGASPLSHTTGLISYIIFIIPPCVRIP